MIRTLILFIALFTASASALCGQSVGIVLSGGGAKGLYHIGVLKALEENGIPIDYISGTSIGAIVGGLYAAGYSPAEIEEVFRSGKVKNWLTGNISPEYKYYFKQMRDNAAMMTLRFDLSDRTTSVSRRTAPLVAPNQMDLASVEFFSPAQAASGDDFNNLFVPFRCVATDAQGKREVVFDKGDLGLAIRASMSVPLVFNPITTDNAVYYDGGMFDNFPWKTLMNDFSPDLLIGVNCLETDLAPEQASLIDQVFSLTTLHTRFVLPRETDIMLERTLDNIPIMDFEKGLAAIEMGYDDAMAHIERIREEVPRMVPPQLLAARRRQFRARQPELILGNINIEGLNPRQTQYVRKLLRLHRHEMDDTNPYTLDDFRLEYFKILAEGEVLGEYPKVKYNHDTGKYDLSIRMSTKPSFRVMVGGNISSTALNQAYIGIEYKTIGSVANSYNVDGYLSTLYSSATIGGRMDFYIRSPFYWDYSASSNFYNYFRSNYGHLSKGNDLSYSQYDDHYATVSVGLPTGRHTVLNLRSLAGINKFKYFQNTGYQDADTMDRTLFRHIGMKLELERRNTNYLLYPTRGIYQSLSVIGISGREYFIPGSSGRDLGQERERKLRQWFGARFTREHYFTMKSVKWFSWGYLVDAVLTNHPSFQNDYVSNISSPAFTPTQHSKIVYMKEFRSDSYIGTGLMANFEFTPQLYIKLSGYGYLPSEYEVKESIRSRIRSIFDISFVYQTYFGPVSFSASQYDATKRNNWFLTFNFGYALFSKKGLFY